MKTKYFAMMLGLAVALTLPAAWAANEKEEGPELEGIKCPISGHDVDASATCSHNGGTVYMCCGKCVKAFEKDSEKFATKANYQLAATKQAKQSGCPISGGKTKEATAIEIGDSKVSVAFCCDKCKAKAEAASGDDQITMLFGEKAFAKGFKVGEKEKE